MDDDDVGMAEGRSRLGLLDEALTPFEIGDPVRRQDLDGDGPVEVGVDGLINGAHAAFADLLGDPVVEERLAGQVGERHIFPFFL